MTGQVASETAACIADAASRPGATKSPYGIPPSDVGSWSDTSEPSPEPMAPRKSSGPTTAKTPAAPPRSFPRGRPAPDGGGGDGGAPGRPPGPGRAAGRTTPRGGAGLPSNNPERPPWGG